MRQEMSFVSVILFIAIGLLVFTILFLFAKRQIARFTLKSARNPHAVIGADAPKLLRLEIERRLKRTQEIRGEPRLVSAKYEEAFKMGPHKDNLYLYRMKAVDSLKQLDHAIKSQDGPARRPEQNLRQYLLGLLSGPLKARAEVVHEFCDCYDHARHDPAVFKEEDYDNYMRLLHELIASTKTKQVSRQNSTASSDSATSQTALLSQVTNPDNVFCRQRRDQSMTALPEETSV